MKTKNLRRRGLAAVLDAALVVLVLLKPIQSQASKVKADTAEELQARAAQAQLSKANADAAHQSRSRPSCSRSRWRCRTTSGVVGVHPGCQRHRGTVGRHVADGDPLAADRGVDGVMTITSGSR